MFMEFFTVQQIEGMYRSIVEQGLGGL